MSNRKFNKSITSLLKSVVQLRIVTIIAVLIVLSLAVISVQSYFLFQSIQQSAELEEILTTVQEQNDDITRLSGKVNTELSTLLVKYEREFAFYFANLDDYRSIFTNTSLGTFKVNFKETLDNLTDTFYQQDITRGRLIELGVLEPGAQKATASEKDMRFSAVAETSLNRIADTGDNISAEFDILLAHHQQISKAADMMEDQNGVFLQTIKTLERGNQLFHGYFNETNTEHYGGLISKLSSLQNSLFSLINYALRIHSNVLGGTYSDILNLTSIWTEELKALTETVNIHSGIFLNSESRTSEESELKSDLDSFLHSNSSSLLPVVLTMNEDITTLINQTGKLKNLVEIEVADVILETENRFTELINLALEEVKETREFIRVYFNQVTGGISSSRIVVIVFLVILVFFLFIFSYQVWKLTRGLTKGFEGLKEKNLKVRPFKKYTRGELGQIQEGFDSAVRNLQGVLENLASSSELLANLSQSMAKNTEVASASIGQVSETIGVIANGAANQTEIIFRIVKNLEDHRTEVGSASEKISQASEFVKKIAKRTNILSLNAAIEAAKAGHFGGGFSVVAENVRTLSDDSKNSASEISELIEDVSSNINLTVELLVKEVSDMKDFAETTATGAEEANAASVEQVEILNQINAQASEVAKVANQLFGIMSSFKF